MGSQDTNLPPSAPVTAEPFDASLDSRASLAQALGEEVLRQLEGADSFLQALARQPLTPDAVVCAETLHDCILDMTRLMRRASGLNAVSAGIAAPEPKPTLLHQVIDGVEARWSGRARQLGVTLLTAFDGTPEHSAEIDADRLAEAFDALVERALAETSRGAVEVSLAVHPAEDGVRLEGCVRDGGPPLDDARLARVFDAIDGGSSLTVGLGMAYAAAAIQSMNGLIRAEANPGGGASITFEMIAAEAKAVETVVDVAIAPAAAHILIVDDNATNRMVAEALCEMFDCTSEQATDGVEALEAVSVRRFDLILMDIKMPRMDGVAATRAIRAMAGPVGATPIVALTANADPQDVKVYLEAGMNGCVEKPIKAERLLSVLDEVLSAVPAEPKSDRGTAAA